MADAPNIAECGYHPNRVLFFASKAISSGYDFTKNYKLDSSARMKSNVNRGEVVGARG